MSFTRRDLLRMAGAGIAVEVLGLPAAASDTDQERLIAASRRLLGGHCSAAAMGEAWLRAKAAPEQHLASLVAEVMRVARVHGADLSGGGGAMLEAYLHDRIERDFAEANVVTVDGWMLSHVEARLRGIAYLGAAAGI